MNIIGMIPAREGSKRILYKNIKPFNGKPIINYPIQTLSYFRDAGVIDNIIIFTDSNLIADIAIENNVSVEKRVSNDFQTLTDTCSMFLELHQPDYLLVMLPTAVFVDKFILFEAFNELEEKNNIDLIATFCKYPHPVQRAFSFKDYQFKMIDNKHMFTRTQDLPDSYYDAGQMYLINVNSFLKQKKIFMENIHPIMINAIDIDNPDDWTNAEFLVKYKINR
jgi:N-acylneuraminate cytidylyltransferase